MIREYKIGDRVQLEIPSRHMDEAPPGLRAFDGCEFEISRIVVVGHGRNVPGSMRGVYYELDGCVSAEDVPYGLIKDWLVPVREEDLK